MTYSHKGGLPTINQLPVVMGWRGIWFVKGLKFQTIAIRRKHSFQESFQHCRCDTDFKYENNHFPLYAPTVQVLGLRRSDWALTLICWRKPMHSVIIHTLSLFIIKLDALDLYCCH